MGGNCMQVNITRKSGSWNFKKQIARIFLIIRKWDDVNKRFFS